jgi:hypothetical protein
VLMLLRIDRHNFILVSLFFSRFFESPRTLPSKLYPILNNFTLHLLRFDYFTLSKHFQLNDIRIRHENMFPNSWCAIMELVLSWH